MKTSGLLAAAALACALGGCASNDGVAAKALDNLTYCKRTYIAAVGGVGVPGGSLFIECPAKPFATQ
jgi:hypothetical protein